MIDPVVPVLALACFPSVQSAMGQAAMEEDRTCWICLCGADGLDTGMATCCSSAMLHHSSDLAAAAPDHASQWLYTAEVHHHAMIMLVARL